MHHAFAVLEGCQQCLSQHMFLRRVYRETGHGQLDGVLFESVQAWKTGGGQKIAIHTQMGVTTWTRPIGQFGVHAFAVHHQGAEQANVLTTVFTHQQSGEALWGLRLHRRVVVYAMLRSQLHIQQAQKVPNFRSGAHSAFAPSTT